MGGRGVLGVLVSNKITSGIKLVEGGSMNRFSGVWGGLGGFRGVKGGQMGVCLTPHRELFAPLEVLYGTRFGSKHHMMVQLAHVNRVGITDPYPDL